MLHRLAEHRLIVAILVVFVALATTYSVVIPPYEILDEQWHYPYVKQIADGDGLPMQEPPPARNATLQEGSQPPLYYLMAAALTSWIDTSEPSPTIWVNPHSTIGIPGAVGNKNMAVHSESEGFPWRGAVLAVHVARLLSVALGAVAVLGTYLVVLAIFPGWLPFAASVAAIAAFIPTFVFVSAGINNDNLVNAVVPFALLTIFRVIRSGTTRGRAIALGLLLGAAALAKLSGLGLFPLAGLAILVDGWRRRSVHAFVTTAATVFGLAALVAGWWYVRNLVLYGEPLGLQRMLDIVHRRSLSPAELLGEIEGLKFNFWALFGGLNIFADLVLYEVFLGVTIAALAGLVVWVMRRGWRARPMDPALLALSLLWLLIVTVSFVRWTTMTMATQGRHLYAALAVLALLLALGLHGWLPARLGRRAGPIFPAAFALGLFCVSVVAPFRYMLPAYADPPRLPESAIASVPNPLSIRFDNRLELVGYDLQRDDGGSAEDLHPGDRLALTLYWRRIGPIEQDYSLFVHLLGPAEENLGQLDTYPGEGTWPTRRWRSGEIVVDRERVEVRDGPVPMLARVEIGFYSDRTLERLPATGSHGDTLGTSLRLRDLAVRAAGAPPAPSPAGPNPTDLIGFRLTFADGRQIERPFDPAAPPVMETLKPGEPISLALRWQANRSLGADYTVFTQFVGERANPRTGNPVWGQHDARPRGGRYPTPFWLPGEVVEDEHQLSLDAAAGSGEYRLVAGLYELGGMQRLRFGNLDHLVLARIQVR